MTQLGSEADQSACAGDPGFIQGSVIAVDGDQSGDLGLFVAGHDRFGAGLLGVEGFLILSRAGRSCTAGSPAMRWDGRRQSRLVRL
ncbi:hypothetical protein LAUMK41_05866 [Mycobacterium attenuatum]|nr:hypothetical protein LAUMK41_05866 [Mycobacterium attenuatum]